MLVRTAKKGFTLMEVMVSVTIFTIVMTVGIVALLTINNTYRQSQTQRSAIDSLTYVLESMSRRIRTAASWELLPSDYGTTTRTFEIIDQDGIPVIYRFIQTPDPKITMEIKSCVGTACPTQVTVAPGDYDLTPAKVVITDMTFFPTLSAGTNGQPYLQLTIQGTVTEGKQASDFLFQTGVSQRAFGIQGARNRPTQNNQNAQNILTP